MQDSDLRNLIRSSRDVALLGREVVSPVIALKLWQL